MCYNNLHKIKRGNMTMQNAPLSSDYDTTISLLNIYFSEWHHRSQTLWSQTFKFYYAVLIIILLPNITSYFQIVLPKLPAIFFRIIGLFLSFIFLYISLGYAIRLHCIGVTYQNIISKLPYEYQREKIKNLKYKNIYWGKPFSLNLSYIICITLFLSLLILSILFIITS